MIPNALPYAGGLLRLPPKTGSMPLPSVLELFQDMLKFSQTFTGKGGRRRNGCMVNCDATDAAASAAVAYLAGGHSSRLIVITLMV